MRREDAGRLVARKVKLDDKGRVTFNAPYNFCKVRPPITCDPGATIVVRNIPVVMWKGQDEYARHHARVGLIATGS